MLLSLEQTEGGRQTREREKATSQGEIMALNNKLS